MGRWPMCDVIDFAKILLRVFPNVKKMSSDCRDRNLGIYNGIEQSSGPNHHGHCDIKLIVNLLPSEYTVVDITDDILICQCDSGFESNGKVVMKSIVFRNNLTFHVFVGEQILDLSEVDVPNRYVLNTVGITDVCKKVSRLELCQGVAMRTDVTYITSHKFTLEHWKDIKSDKRTSVQLRSIKCNKVKPFSSISDKCSKCKYIWASKNIPNSESIKNASTNVLLSLLPTDVESNTPENGLIEERLSNGNLQRPNKKLPAVVKMEVDVDNDDNCVQTESISICENQPTSTLSDTLPVLKPTISESLPRPATCYTESMSTTEEAISGFSLSIQPLEMTQCVNGSRKSKKRPYPVNFVAVNRTPNSPETVGDLVTTLVKSSYEITTSQLPVTVKQEPEEGGDHINIMDHCDEEVGDHINIMDHCETRSTCSYQRLNPDQQKERNSSVTTSQLPVTVKQEPGEVRASYMNDYHETQPTTSNQLLNPEQSKGNPPEETATCQSSVIIKQEEDIEKTDYSDSQSTSSNHSTNSVKPNQVYRSTLEFDEETTMAISPSNIDSFVKNKNHIPNKHTVDVIPPESNEKDDNARYGQLSTDNDIENLRKASATNKRKRSNEWGMNLWDSWRKWRNDRSLKNSLQESAPYVLVPALTVDLTAHELNYWLCRFIIEVRRHDGNDYPVDSLRQLCVSIWRYLRDTFRRYDLNMFDRKLVDFVEARECLQSRMKSLEITAKPKRKIEPISPSEEELLWTKCFNKKTARNLQFAVYFYNCKLFGIRAAEEHVCLSVDQFEVASDSTGEFMWFRGENSKIVQGRVFDNKVDQKVKQYADASNPRCVVALFKKYLNYIPKDGYFYRRPLAKSNQNGTPRYSEQKVGVHAIQRYMERMCSEAGITGYKTALSEKKDRTSSKELSMCGLQEKN